MGKDAKPVRPFTPRELSAVEASIKEGKLRTHETIIRRLVATIRDREERNGEERIDALGAENLRLADELRQLQESRKCYRVLVLAERDESIEVYADPQVRIAVACLPENRTNEERERAEAWALDHVPYEFRSMPNENIRPNIYSTHCMTREKFAYYQDKIKAWGIIKLLESEIVRLTDDANQPRPTEDAGGEAQEPEAAARSAPAERGPGTEEIQ